MEQGSGVGRVIALDEAHKYMGDGQESLALTESLKTAIRVQRHIGARVIISTQEPTISPSLLDLCSVTIVHRFSSPEWLGVLKKHLAGASTWSEFDGESDDKGQATLAAGGGEVLTSSTSDNSYVGVKTLSTRGNAILSNLFRKIVALRTGEALLFSPSAAIGVKTITVEDTEDDEDEEEGEVAGMDDPEERKEVVRLGHEVLMVRVRKRVTQDGGQSIMAT